MKYFLKFFFALSFIVTLFYSCGGYNFSDSNSVIAGYKTISVDCINDGGDSYFLNDLIKAITINTNLSYRKQNGDLELKVEKLSYSNENIGFRHKLDDEGKFIDEVIQSESRINAYAEVVVSDLNLNKVILGPFKITATLDYDYDIDSNRENQLNFSLGQLSTDNAAYDVAKKSLNKLLSQKILDYINNSW